MEELPVISSYTRKQAITDGVLVDITQGARGSGIKYPTAVTAEVWARYCQFSPESEGQSISGRIHDIVWMLFLQIRRQREKTCEIHFQLYVAVPDGGDWWPNETGPEPEFSRRTHRLVKLKALCGPGDAGEPVITIMLPNQD